MRALVPAETEGPMNGQIVALLLPGCLSTPALAGRIIASPLLGRWIVDTSRLPMPPAARPKGVTIAFHPAGAARLTMQVDIVGADGERVCTVGSAPLDVLRFRSSTVRKPTRRP